MLNFWAVFIFVFMGIFCVLPLCEANVPNRELGRRSHSEKVRYNLVEGLPDIYLTSSSEKIGHTWANGIVWDKDLIREFYLLLSRQNPDFIVIDLGAQTGSFSLLAKYFPDSRWYAFEPIREAAEALKVNLFLNGINNVSVYQVAASDFSGRAVLKMPDMNEWGLSTMGANVLRFVSIAEREIDCIDLDSFVAANHIDQVHFMKLDTEGWELHILKGAKNLIIRDRPIILMEYNETNMKQCGVIKKEVDDFLQSMGYDWRLISSEDILCSPIN
jgi:FkbM family methyltransferase